MRNPCLYVHKILLPSFSPLMFVHLLEQDHNKDFIVEFPDFDPSLKSGSNLNEGHLQNLFMRHSSRRFSFREKSSSLPQPHLWFSTAEVIHALKLFLDAGNDLAGSFTYR